MGLHEVLFPKKKGLALTAAQPYVKEVYQNQYPKAALPKCPSGGVRSYKIGQIGHISYHSIPSSTGWFGLLFLSFVFLYSPLHTPEMKVVSVVGAFLYTLAESAFTRIERGKNYTSLAQFIANLVYIPVLLQLYPVALRTLVVPGSSSSSSSSGGPGFLPFVLLYPLNIWLLEVLQQLFILTPIWGHNVAWCYKDYSDEFLGGAIRIGHAPAWWALGAAVWYGKGAIEAIARTVLGGGADQEFKLWE